MKALGAAGEAGAGAGAGGGRGLWRGLKARSHNSRHLLLLPKPLGFLLALLESGQRATKLLSLSLLLRRLGKRVPRRLSFRRLIVLSLCLLSRRLASRFGSENHRPVTVDLASTATGGLVALAPFD